VSLNDDNLEKPHLPIFLLAFATFHHMLRFQAAAAPKPVSIVATFRDFIPTGNHGREGHPGAYSAVGTMLTKIFV
jgi:hypothetical protein